MRRLATSIYVVWCLAIVAGFLLATNYAWSPFANGSRSLVGGGPTQQHK